MKQLSATKYPSFNFLSIKFRCPIWFKLPVRTILFLSKRLFTQRSMTSIAILLFLWHKIDRYYNRQHEWLVLYFVPLMVVSAGALSIAYPASRDLFLVSRLVPSLDETRRNGTKLIPFPAGLWFVLMIILSKIMNLLEFTYTSEGSNGYMKFKLSFFCSLLPLLSLEVSRKS